MSSRTLCVLDTFQLKSNLCSSCNLAGQKDKGTNNHLRQLVNRQLDSELLWEVGLVSVPHIHLEDEHHAWHTVCAE